MTFDQLIKSIAAKEYAPIYFFHGEESFYIDQLTKAIENSVLPEEEKSFNQVVLYGKESDFKQVVDNARQFPMMASHRVVILKEAQEMRTITQLESYAQSPSPQTILVIAYKHKKLDKRTKFAKAISKTALVFESKKLYDNQLGPWISQRVTAMGYKMGPDAVRLIGEYLGADLNKINNELQKLVINLPKASTIDTKLIQSQIGISKDFNVFELHKAIGQKNMSKVAMIFNYFGENAKSNPPPMVIPSIFQFIAKVLIAKSLSRASDQELQRALSLHSAYFVKDYRLAANNFTVSALKYMMDRLHTADLQSKGIGYKNMKPSQIYAELSGVMVNL